MIDGSPLVGLIPLDIRGAAQVVRKKLEKSWTSWQRGLKSMLFPAGLGIKVGRYHISNVWFTICRHVSLVAGGYPRYFWHWTSWSKIKNQPMAVDVKLWFEAEAGVLVIFASISNSHQKVPSHFRSILSKATVLYILDAQAKRYDKSLSMVRQGWESAQLDKVTH